MYNFNWYKGVGIVTTIEELLSDPCDALAWAAAADLAEEDGRMADAILLRSLDLRMTKIPAGVLVPSSPDQEGTSEDQAIGEFYLGIYPVTQAQWQAVMGSNPSHFKGANRPVENVSWDDCQAFCSKLEELTGKRFRLPTSDEWEYACRAGTSTEYYTGDGEEALDRAGWYIGNSNNQTHPVGEKAKNAWGLYDMHGNVWEWTSALEGSNRVIRGGCWNEDGQDCRSAFRYRITPAFRLEDLGFRLACEL